MEITQKLLLNAGGWQAMKAAQVLWEARRVAEPEYAPPQLRALVKDGGAQYRAGLNILSASQIDNLCTCRESRQWGNICAHSLAAGLAWIGRDLAPKTTRVEVAAPAKADTLPLEIVETNPDFRLHLILPPRLETESLENVMVVAEIEAAGRRSPLSTLQLNTPRRCESLDAVAINLLSAFSGGKLPAMATFSAAEFLQFAAAVQAHPRVTFGKGKLARLADLLGRSAPPATAAKDPAPAETAFGPVVLEIEGSLNHLAAKLFMTRRGALWPVSPGSVADQTAIERLERLGFTPSRLKKEWVLQGEMAIVRFLASGLPGLQRDWKVNFGARLTNVTAEIERIDPKVTIRDAGERWFDLEFSLSTQDGARFSQEEISRLLRSGSHSVRKPNGKLAIFNTELLEEFQGALAQSEPDQVRPGQYRVERRHAWHLQSALESLGTTESSEKWRNWIGQAGDPVAIKTIQLGRFESILRPYQKQGVYWMHFIAKHELGGVLADEMGLGKTVQTLAFLDSLRLTKRAPSLVVCPSSLVFNWKREAGHFVPDMKVATFESGEGKLEMNGVDLLVTSYGMLRRHAEKFAILSFESIILDEAQHIKNSATQNARLAMSLRAKSRFALTGTPLENSLMDLWSLMNFTLPGYLGEKKLFAEQYLQTPGEEGQISSRRHLAKRIAPYLLRRRKDELLTELPPKTIQVMYAEMTKAQRELHQAYVGQAREELEQLAKVPKNKLKIFTMLTRLRQTACDTRLLGEQTEMDDEEASGKLKLLEELLAEITDAGRRVLIFSQFVSMLQLISQQLKRNEIPFSYLDGSTTNREAVVQTFKTNPAIPVFLISLKAGGFGLNLTEADTVIHFDPWWNPAVEAQASDRIHRIGQTRPVTIYKLISAGSIEEKMLKLQERKSSVLSSILEETQAAEKLNFEDLRELIA